MTSAAWPQRWRALWTALRLPEPQGALDALLARYAEPHRHYHTARHLEECLQAFEPLRADCEHPPEAELALWFHDAVYDTRRDDNEALSAAAAARALAKAGAPEAMRQRVHALVVATRHEAPAPGADAAAVVDADLAILAAPATRFEEYEAQIREEYGWVPEARYLERRARTLRRLLEREWIYSSEYGKSAWERRARANVARLIAKLTS